MGVVENLHVEVLGDGPAAIFIHGTFGWGSDSFPEQRTLASLCRIMLVDRRGFGGSRSMDAAGWPVDMQDIADLLDEVRGAHLVGHSYGAVVALLAAGLRPERVLSLVVIEPNAFEIAKGDPDAEASAAALKPVYARVMQLTTSEFVSEWGRARGKTEHELRDWIGSFGDDDWVAAEASRRECWPGDPPIEFDVLAAAAFPKVIVRGGWNADLVGRDGAGRDFAAVCRVLAERIGASTVVFEQSMHNPQLEEPDPFNSMLRDLWSSVGLTT